MPACFACRMLQELFNHLYYFLKWSLAFNIFYEPPDPVLAVLAVLAMLDVLLRGLLYSRNYLHDYSNI